MRRASARTRDSVPVQAIAASSARLLAQRPDSYVIFNRVKYELVDGKLTKELVLN